jgi:hypothetical protein
MPNRSSKPPKRPRDANQLAKSVVDQATQEAPAQADETPAPKEEKNPAAVALGRLGGLKGGKARTEKLTAQKRSAIAKKAAAAPWKKDA